VKKGDLLNFTILNTDKICSDFNVDDNFGLSRDEAARRLQEYGKNELSLKKTKWWEILIRQFKSPFIYLLVGASVLALLLGELFDGLMILVFLLINALLGFYQEFKSEKILKLLKQFVVSYVRVIRKGELQNINSEELVPGDIILVETGDKIPADIRFIEACNLTVDESIITGESLAINKTSETQKKKASDYFQAKNLGFSGTIVINGKGKGIVLATGKNTIVGKLSKLVVESKHVSSFEKGISKFSKFILKLVGITLLLIFLANVFIKGGEADIAELILFSIALAVSVIPEALPVVTTFSLSRGAQKLAKQKVVVKRLSAIEDLGGIEILCTDKTGTLTENRLKVLNIYAKDHKEALFYANLSVTNLQKMHLEPFDIALWKKISKEEKEKIFKYHRIKEIPFDPKIRRNIVLTKVNKKFEIITRGAPEEIFKLCTNLSGENKKHLCKWIKKEGEMGRRVLAVAKKEIEEKNIKNDFNLEKETNKFHFLGIISFVDPIKDSTDEAVKDANKLGVKIKIITGDSPEVAGAVACQIGLIKSPKEVITGENLEKLSKREQEKAIDEYSVFARISPEQKYKIIQTLEDKYSVGFLGEGINDAPALKIADVSLVVDSASDIARDASDIVLLKKNLKVIVEGIRDGREVFINTTKYIRATLTSNFGNFFAVAIASLLIDFLPMLPLQILLLNLLSDFPMIAISTDTVEKKELSMPKKYNVRDIVLLAIVLGVVSTIFDFIYFGLFYKISPEVLQTNWFIGSVLTELLLLFSIRSRGFFLKSSRPSKTMFILTILAIVVTIILPFTILGKMFNFVAPTIRYLQIIFGVAITYFACTEIIKNIYNKTLNNKIV